MHPITISYMISVFKTESVFGRFFGLKHKIPKKDTPHTCQESTRTNAQCGNFEIFLSLRFYVKSTLVHRVSKKGFYNFRATVKLFMRGKIAKTDFT